MASASSAARDQTALGLPTFEISTFMKHLHGRPLQVHPLVFDSGNPPPSLRPPLVSFRTGHSRDGRWRSPACFLQTMPFSSNRIRSRLNEPAAGISGCDSRGREPKPAAPFSPRSGA
jgi:hypothetical protein